MPSNQSHSFRDALANNKWQLTALLGCFFFGLLLIWNEELAGNAVWFYYAELFHNGLKLFHDMHMPLQPFLVLETNAWMRIFGAKDIATEVLPALHVLVLCVGVLLVVRETTWTDGQKAIALFGGYIVATHFNAYLFDDYHVTADIFYFYALALLLIFARTDTERGELRLAGILGVLSGFAVTNRINDGAAVLLGSGLCVLLLARRRRWAATGLFSVAALLAMALIIKLTGDTFSDYVSNTVLKAAGSKGGGGSLLADPFLLFLSAAKALRAGGKWTLVWIALMIAAGAWTMRRWRFGVWRSMLVQIVIGVVGVMAASHLTRQQLLEGSMIGALTNLSVVAVYLLSAIVAVRWFLAAAGRTPRRWDRREVIVSLIFLGAAAGSASTGGKTGDFFETMAMLLLLIAVIYPFGAQMAWPKASLMMLLLVMGVTGAFTKVVSPYSWHNYVSKPMFKGRVWYRHPVWGWMYIDREKLAFIQRSCAEIQPRGELLSLPYSTPNYYCAIPPWHGYVQTFFDTSTRDTIEDLVQQLQTNPPEWIVYQRQLANLAMHEQIYNHGQRLPHRDLDELIERKIADGQWTQVDKINYLEGDGWLVIHTKPTPPAQSPQP